MFFDDVSDRFSARGAGRDRIMEILVFLLDEMRKNKHLAEIDLNPLSKRGFSQTEISTAFSWLFDKISIAGEETGPVIMTASFGKGGTVDARRDMVETSFRVYHESERSALTIGAQGYLLQMRELGLLSDQDMELIVDRILLSGVPCVDTPDVKELVSGLVFDFDDSTRVGSRMMLSASDTVQ